MNVAAKRLGAGLGCDWTNHNSDVTRNLRVECRWCETTGGAGGVRRKGLVARAVEGGGDRLRLMSMGETAPPTQGRPRSMR